MSDSTATEQYDIFIIGGGINGAAIANDAAGRGLRVGLCEKDDLANATSSASSKLIHGGLRYLELFEFRLVYSALRERKRLLQSAPHLVTPLEFIMPHASSRGRAAWMIRIGLWIYNLLAANPFVSASTQSILCDKSFKPKYKVGFRFWDAWGDDARLVVSNALGAAARGGDIFTRTEFISAERSDDEWLVTLKQQNIYQVRTKVLINAAGPWVDSINAKNKIQSKKKCRLVKGSHIVLPRLYPGEHALLLQNHDSRVVFILPYGASLHLVGTTDVEFSGNPNSVKITADETQYLLDCVNGYLKQQLTHVDILSDFSGVRPLQDEDNQSASAVTRDYYIDINTEQAPYVSIFGGKLTTHRALAENVMQLLPEEFRGHTSNWTRTASLPGGEFAAKDKALEIQKMQNKYAWLQPDLIQQYFARYGMRTHLVLKDTTCIQDMGIYFGNGLYEREVSYLTQVEWAKTAEDILWRRTKLGLQFSQEQTDELRDWLSTTNTI